MKNTDLLDVQCKMNNAVDNLASNVHKASPFIFGLLIKSK